MKKLILGVVSVLSIGSVANAGPWYGEQAYLECNPDVERALYNGQITSAYDHYIVFGQYENRLTDGRCSAADAPRWFDERGYLRCNRDVARAVRQGGFRSGWHHYRTNGQQEGRQPGCNR